VQKKWERRKLVYRNTVIPNKISSELKYALRHPRKDLTPLSLKPILGGNYECFEKQVLI
jgi:hypothetical protein